MINSHSELVKEVLNWADKMDFINKAEYVTDIGNADTIVNNIEPRGFVFAPSDLNIGTDYNTELTYGFTIVDKTSDDLNAVINSETENIFCVSALDDFINYIADGSIDFLGMSFDNVQTESGVLTSISGFFVLNIKRTASYWKVMEEYSE